MPTLLRRWQQHRLKYPNNTTDELYAKIDPPLSDATISMVNGIDNDIPDRIAHQGGTTLSLVVRFQHDYLLFRNTRDSQSFLVTVVDSSKLLVAKVHFVTQLHKPDDPDERMRLLQAGMRVEDKTTVDDSRAWYSTRDPQDNATSIVM
jgi:Protein phosphatase 2C